ncbi:MAG: serine/threonine-protein kinase [Myxococcota bacterium]
MDANQGGWRFEPIAEIGRGGMSVVHKGYDPLLERFTALKVLIPTHDDGPSRARFLDEARITGQLEHPNIVPIYEYGTDPQGREFINMKLVQGTSLLDRIRSQGDARLDPENLAESLQILIKVCDAVAFAHSRGVVHRDLKPSNVMIGGFGEVYVMDWGIALRVDRAHAEPEPGSWDERGILGTPTFVAPEQIDDPDAIDARADVYALGGVLYALLTGRAPHQGRTPMLRLMASSHGRILPPEDVVTDPRLPPSLARIAMRALRRNPADRPSTVGAFRAELLGFLHGAWHLPSRHCPAGTVIVAEGAPGDEAYVIRSGTCQVHNRASGPIRQLGAGEVFGELAVLSSGIRSSTVEAITDVEVLVVTRDVLQQGLGLNTWIGAFVRALAARFADLEGRLARP